MRLDINLPFLTLKQLERSWNLCDISSKVAWVRCLEKTLHPTTLCLVLSLIVYSVRPSFQFQTWFVWQDSTNLAVVYNNWVSLRAWRYFVCDPTCCDLLMPSSEECDSSVYYSVSSQMLAICQLDIVADHGTTDWAVRLDLNNNSQQSGQNYKNISLPWTQQRRMELEPKSVVMVMHDRARVKLSVDQMEYLRAWCMDEQQASIDGLFSCSDCLPCILWGNFETQSSAS